MTYLFIDTETTGLPDFKLDLDHPFQPRVVQIAMIMTDKDANILNEACFILKPNDYTIPDECAAIHGINTETALQHGIKPLGAFQLLCSLIGRSQLIVAHNMKFDWFMIQIELARLGLGLGDGYETYCTADGSRDIIKLPPTQKMIQKKVAGYKNPNLLQAYQFFFNKDFEGTAHTAMADAKACMDIFFAIQKHQHADQKVE